MPQRPAVSVVPAEVSAQPAARLAALLPADPSGSKSAAAKMPKNNVVSIAFIGYSSWHIIERSNPGGNVPNPGDPHRGAYETTCHCQGRVPTPCMLI